MKIEKLKIDNLERCYCGAHLIIDGEDHLLFSEEKIGGACYDYYGEGFRQKRQVWANGGGTMSIIPIRGKEGEFLAIQKFFPGFDAKESKLVWCKLVNNKWIVKDFISIPYMHRFDILYANNKQYLVIGVLCIDKKNREDWSTPGKVMYGILPDEYSNQIDLFEFNQDIYINHGYSKRILNNKEYCFFAGRDGVFKVYEKNHGLVIEKIFNKSVSDISFIDIDNDDKDEMLTIEPFHGNQVNIYKYVEGQYKKIYSYNKKVAFAHAIMGGTLLGKNSFVFGVRRENMELIILQYDKIAKQIKEIEVDTGVGPANIEIINKEGFDYILSCNHSTNEAALYKITND